MVDVVVNHVAATSSGNFVPNESYGPFNSTAQYHPFCWVDDYNNQVSDAIEVRSVLHKLTSFVRLPDRRRAVCPGE